MKLKLFIFLLLPINLLFSQVDNGFDNDSIVAGFRASRLLNNYPNNEFPSAEYWQNVGDQMASKFDNAQAAGIWIVSLYMGNGVTKLNFPSPGGSYENIWFTNEDQNEDYLSYFDENGLKVWLQVESGAADIDTLMKLVFDRYQQHPCVIGFGVDGEWYQAQSYPEGKPVSDDEAESWENSVKSYNQDYTLFLKHYHPDWMPPEYRGEIIFVDDSQDFTWASNPFNAMIEEFANWATVFSPARSAFQFGYPVDESWWSELEDPPMEIGQALIENIPESYGIFWVDFTINDIFPILAVNSLLSPVLNLHVYPNPFRQNATILLELPYEMKARFEIYNESGILVREKPISTFEKGKNKFSFKKKGLSPGIYFYRFVSEKFIVSDRFIIVE
jgi:hypothetical protein